jgi:hypothetical protein
MSMNVEAEIRDLKRRVAELEGSFGFLTQQVRSVHRDLLGFQAKMEQFQTNTGRGFDKIEGRLDRVEKSVRDFRDELPKTVGSVMREVLREERAKAAKKR